MKKFLQYHNIEKNIGSLKFAVVLLLIFAFLMIIGTFFESYYGTDYANRTIYKTWFFMLLQFCMFLSIIFAAFRRLPPKKRLYGFYSIHLGLIIIGAGSFITWHAGVDGSLFLPPNSPSREVILTDDVLKIHFPREGKVVDFKLPYTAFEKDLNIAYNSEIKLLNYLPFSDLKFNWVKAKTDHPNTDVHSSKYLISNAMVTQEFTLSLHPEAHDFKSSITLGPLSLHYLPQTLSKCFQQTSKAHLILWDKEENSCFSPSERNIQIVKTKSGKRFFALQTKDQTLSFFPDLSPWPLDENMEIVKDATIRVFSKKLFQEKPHLFLFGKSLSYYDKEEEKWKFSNINSPIELPWMGLEVQLLEHKENLVPQNIPIYKKPIQVNNQLVSGTQRALQIKVQDETFWVTNEKPVELLINGQRTAFQLAKESLTLPFEFVLTKFKMETDPGTNNPASYESFVKLFTSTGPENHHIYMNNPLKRSGFTFYQASYSQDNQGNYSSTLSVNVDPGRPIKYLGCLLLVFGSIAHYLLNKRSKKLKNPHPIFEVLK